MYKYSKQHSMERSQQYSNQNEYTPKIYGNSFNLNDVYHPQYQQYSQQCPQQRLQQHSQQRPQQQYQQCQHPQPQNIPKKKENKKKNSDNNNFENDSHNQITPSCDRMSFTVIPNDGNEKNEIYNFHSSCFFRSVTSALNAFGANLHPTDLRRIIGFPNVSRQVDTTSDSHYIQQICDDYCIGIAFFTANYENNGTSLWIGNPALIFIPSNNGSDVLKKFSIVSYGGHYELIISETQFSDDISDNFNCMEKRTYTYMEGNNDIPIISNIVSPEHTSYLSKYDLEKKLANVIVAMRNQEANINMFTDIINRMTNSPEEDDECNEYQLHSYQIMLDAAQQCYDKLNERLIVIKTALGKA